MDVLVLLVQLAVADPLSLDLELRRRQDPIAAHERFCEDLMKDAEKESRSAELPPPDPSPIQRRCDKCLERRCRGYEEWLVRKSDQEAAEIRELQDWCLQNTVTYSLDICRHAFYWPLRGD